MMKESTKELIIEERRRDDYTYLCETIQRGRIKPAKYKHSLSMPLYVYEELRDRGVVRLEDYYVDMSAFFEFRKGEAVISFMTLYACEDLHRRIDYYLVVKYAGGYPLKRTGSFNL